MGDDQALTDYCIARVLIHLDRFQEAFQRFQKIMNGHGIGFHDGNDFLWMTDLGYVLVKLGEYSQGAHYLQEGLNRQPYNCFAWNALAVAQAHQGTLELAVSSLSTGLECDGQSASTWNNLAVVYAAGNQLQGAREALQRAATINATNAVVARNMLVFEGVGSPGEQLNLDLYIP